MTRGYNIKYAVKLAGAGNTFDLSQKEEGDGLCDQLALCAIVDGNPSSIMWISRDGSTGENMKTDRLFSAFIALAGKLARDESLDGGKREMCRRVYEEGREAYLNRRLVGNGDPV